MSRFPDAITRDTIEDMMNAFRIIDMDGSKNIETCELERYLQIMGANPTPQQVQQMIRTIDASGGSKITKIEEDVRHYM